MLKLKDILLEVLQDITPQFQNISKYNGTPLDTMYDFGGSDYVSVNPESKGIKNIIVVDIVDPYIEDFEDKNIYFIKKNLFVPVNLPTQAKEIQANKLIRYAGNKEDIIIDNIDKHLIKGGILRIFEDSDEDDNYDSLMLRIIEKFKLKGYSVIKIDGINYGDVELAILKK
tara:strand:- start:1305 stop:1817 length:513 start_codon:yes stop_codon:yes gene_type:complete